MRNAVTVTLPRSTLDALDGYARERNLPRSYAAQELFERALPAQRGATRSDSQPVPSERTAHGEHLAEHGRLSAADPYRTVERGQAAAPPVPTGSASTQDAAHISSGYGFARHKLPQE